MADEKNRKGDKGPKSGKTKRTVGTVLGTGFFAVLSLIIIFPVFAGLLASFRPGTELIRRGLSIDLDIRTMNLDNYKYLFSGNADSQKYFMWYKNSLVITIVSVVLTLFICYFVAYGLTMYNFKLKNFLFFLVIATMMVPFEILMLPLYKEIIALHLIDRVRYCDKNHSSADEAGIRLHGNSAGNGKLECDPVAASGTEGSRKVHPSDRIEYIADAVRKQL